MSYPMNKKSLEIDRMIREWYSTKQISLALRVAGDAVIGRANRNGFHRYYINEAEKELVTAWRRLAPDAQRRILGSVANAEEAQ